MAREKKDDNKVVFNSSTAELSDVLNELEEKYKDNNAILGMTLLTHPIYTSSSRTLMTTGHLKQRTNMNNPEFPKVFTEFFNMVGEHSSGIQRARNNLEIKKKICKFKNDHIYILVVQNTDTGEYDIIEKKIVEDLTEKFGYVYNNESLDKLKVGSTVKKGDLLYKSTSYDDYNNYCIGVNATFSYTSDIRTTEDAIIISESFQKRTKTTEVETIRVSINDNDVLLNIYGDSENYKTFPDIGEKIKDKIICATRRIDNDQIFFDFKESNLRKINFSNDTLCVEGASGGKIVDITVYSNKFLDEMKENEYHSQLNYYYENELRYYQEIYDSLKDIVVNNLPHSIELNRLYKKAKEILNKDVKWCEVQTKKPFSNVILEFVVARETPLKKGSKVTGLYGNKGVISAIEKDEDMPVLENGKRVEICFNRLGVINRINTFQLFEQSINFIMNRTIDRMKTLETNEQRANLVFMMIKYFNEDQEKRMKELYNKYDDKQKDEFIQDIYERGIYVNIPPFWHKKPLFHILQEIYKKHGDWLTPYKVFKKINGRYRPIMTENYTGEMYIIRLKQTAAKGFSSRSVGGVSLIGVPIKDAQAKENKILYPKTPCRWGIDELLNLLIGMKPISLAKQNMSYRNSIEGTRDLPTRLLKDGHVDKLRTDSDIINRNVEVFDAYLKPMGLKLEEYKETVELLYPELDNGEEKEREYNGERFKATDTEYVHYIVETELEKAMEEEYFVGTEEEYLEKVEEMREKIISSLEE